MMINDRVLNHFINMIDAGMNTASVNKYPVTSHCATPATTENSCINWVNAMFSAVSLNNPVNTPSIRVLNISTGECTSFSGLLNFIVFTFIQKVINRYKITPSEYTNGVKAG
ncbi:TPA: hypothetical protein NVL94_004958 [Citrobacter freundii]|nr:hypothetical protein [Citrobacter freundii]